MITHVVLRDTGPAATTGARRLKIITQTAGISRPPLDEDEYTRPGGLWFAGQSGNYVTTPDHASLDVNDLDLAAVIRPFAPRNGWPQIIAARYSTASNFSWQWYLATDGRAVLLWSSNGTTVAVTSTASVVAPEWNGEADYWARVTLDANNEASGYTVNHQTAPGVPWWRIPTADEWETYATTTGGATTTVFQGTGRIDIGSINGAATGSFHGTIRRFVQRASIDGPIILDPVFEHPETRWRSASPTFIDGPGRTWTMVGTGWSWRDSVRPGRDLVFAFEGDSITCGTATTGATQGQAWYQVMQRTLSRSFDGIFRAYPSRQVSAWITEDPTDLDEFCPDDGRGYVFGFGGTNDLFFGASAGTVQTRYQDWCEARQAAGWKVIAFTILPRSDTSTPGTFETSRQTFNTWLRANWATFADALVDVAADTRIGDVNDELDTTYYSTDKVHLIAAGQAIVATLVADTLRSTFDIE
jgi:lysophospholipase L1-like esterase